MNTLIESLAKARDNCHNWENSLPTGEWKYDMFYHICDSCSYTCKRKWRFVGKTGKSGQLYTVGPLCNVLWLFSDDNRRAIHLSLDTASRDLPVLERDGCQVQDEYYQEHLL